VRYSLYQRLGCQLSHLGPQPDPVLRSRWARRYALVLVWWAAAGWPLVVAHLWPAVAQFVIWGLVGGPVVLVICVVGCVVLAGIQPWFTRRLRARQRLVLSTLDSASGGLLRRA